MQRTALRTILMSLAVLGLVVSTAACGDDDGGGGGGVTNGIYQMTTADSYENSCEGEAVTLLGTGAQEYFYVRTFRFFGQPIVNAVACADPAACNAIANEEDGFSHDWAHSTDSWRFSRTDFQSEMCIGEYSYASITAVDEDVIVETFVHEIEDVPEDSDGFCDGDVAQSKVSESNCSRRIVYQGTFVEALKTTGEGTIYM